MCGIIALISGNVECDDAAVDLHEALYALQHRGQDACGIATSHRSGRIYSCKGKGLASKVFRDGALFSDLPGFMGLGHLRYTTAGTSSNAESQPFYVSSPYGILFSHNGNLLDTETLKEYLDFRAHRYINTDSDSEVMLQIFASQLLQTDKRRVDVEDLFTGLKHIWWLRIMRNGGRICHFGARDPNGIWPLIMGSRPNADGKGMDYMLASESVALDQLGFTNVQDIKPGQAVLSYTPDIFEYCYFARETSIIDGISVYESQQQMGLKLASTIHRLLGQHVVDDIDVVIPIPDLGIVHALAVAEALQRPYQHAFTRNRYIFRKFIMPNQEKRRKGVQSKLNALRTEFKGKNVLLIDDTHPHIYGIDLATSTELVAYNRDRKAIASSINADEVVFLDLADLEVACAGLSPRPDQKFEVGVFCGRYVTPVSQGYLENLEKSRGKSRATQSGSFITVGHSMTTRQTAVERSDVSLHNLGDQ